MSMYGPGEPSGVSRVLGAVRRRFATDLSIATIEQVEDRGQVGRAAELVTDAFGVRRLIGRLSISVLDQLVTLGAFEREHRNGAVEMEDAEFQLLVENDRGSVGSALDADARPRGQLVGHLVDNCVVICHATPSVEVLP
jgi:hypothetical protein